MSAPPPLLPGLKPREWGLIWSIICAIKIYGIERFLTTEGNRRSVERLVAKGLVVLDLSGLVSFNGPPPLAIRLTKLGRLALNSAALLESYPCSKPT